MFLTGLISMYNFFPASKISFSKRSRKRSVSLSSGPSSGEHPPNERI